MRAIQTDCISFKVDTFQLKDISLSIPKQKITSIVVNQHIIPDINYQINSVKNME